MKKCQGKSNLQIVQDYLDGNRPFSQVGYRSKKVYKKREDGEIWTDEQGVKWECRGDAHIRINEQTNLIRKMTEEVCKCGQSIKLGSHLDVIFFRKCGMCENCLITYETNLRILGIYPHYEKYKILSNEVAALIDGCEQLKEIVKFFETERGDVHAICNGEGYIEQWKNTNNSQILEESRKDLKLIKDRLKVARKDRDLAKKAYVSISKKFKQPVYV